MSGAVARAPSPLALQPAAQRTPRALPLWVLTHRPRGSGAAICTDQLGHLAGSGPASGTGLHRQLPKHRHEPGRQEGEGLVIPWNRMQCMRSESYFTLCVTWMHGQRRSGVCC